MERAFGEFWTNLSREVFPEDTLSSDPYDDSTDDLTDALTELIQSKPPSDIAPVPAQREAPDPPDPSIELLRQEIDELRASNAALFHKASDLSAENEHLKRQFEATERRFAAELAALNKKTSDLQSSLSAALSRANDERTGLTATIHELTEENTAFKTLNSDLTNELTSQRAECAFLRTGDSTTRIAELECARASLSERAVALEAENASLSAELAEYVDANGDLARENERLSGDSAVFRTENAELVRENHELVEANDEISGARELLGQQLEDLTRQRENLAAENGALLANLQDTTARMASLATGRSPTKSTANVAGLEEERNALVRTADELRARLAEEVARSARLETELGIAARERDAARDALASHTADLERANEERRLQRMKALDELSE
jgi:chromosome segregation ATPase